MKTALSLLAVIMLYSNASFAAFNCTVSNIPVGSGDTFEFELKPVSQAESYMLEGKIHGLNIFAMKYETNLGYTVEVTDPQDLERGFYIKTGVRFSADEDLRFHYPVKELKDIISLIVKCSL